MLGRDDNGVDLDRGDGSIGMLRVFDGDLGLTVGAQPPQGTVLADICQTLSQLRGHHVGQRHAVFSFVTGVTKHDTLVTGTNIQFGLADVDSSGDIRGLLVDTDQNFAVVAVQTLGLDRAQIINERIESDFTDLFTDDGFVVDLSGSGDLTENHDHVVLGGSFAGDLGERIGLQTSIQNSIRNLIGKLIGVTLVHGFTREEEVAFFSGRHGVV
mmetsp:Transcript_10218/g.21085  ORF Transcript_10218/g.21085 Transcript_10218/m.21085 type:complete len:213 (+) Transcript_10218:928-1566(+)